MNARFLAATFPLAIAIFAATGPIRAAEPKDGVPLFDGKSFAGWEGNLKQFRIEDGAIVGGTLKEKIPRNEFLCTEKEYGDFELRLKFKLVGKGANGGVQLRSHRIPNHNEVKGYQADMGDGWWGCLYDEARRNKVLARADAKLVDKVLKHDDWNDYTIRCEGKHIQLWLNGQKTVDYTEADDAIPQRGVIGLQIHGGPPSEAWYKDLSIKQLQKAE
jgi:3-keto-disaccharide hydrolase